MVTIDLSRLRWLLILAVAAGAIFYTVRDRPVLEEEFRPALAQAGKLRPVYSVKTEEKVLSLTFDISWGEKMAPKVLDVLKQHGVKATFFLSGPWSKHHQDLVLRIKEEGHEIQSHGQAHVNFSGLGREGTARNIQAAHAILADLTATKPRYIRPPNGDFNEISLQATREVGYETIIWSVDSRDWLNPGVDAIAQRVLRLLHPGAIVLLHASDSCKQTDQALPAILAGLKAGGWRNLLLTEMMTRYPVDPNGYIH